MLYYHCYMKTKLTVGIFVALFFLVFSAYAQEDNSNSNGIVAKMERQLSLTPEQVEVAKPLIKEYTVKRQQLRQSLKDQGVTESAIILSQMEQLRQEEEQKLTQILTQEQLKKWSNHQKISNVLNKDKMSDTGWESKNSGTGLGASF